MRIRAILVLFLAVVAGPAATIPEELGQRSAVEVLPKSTLIYVELGQSKDLLRFLFDNPARKNFESLEFYRSGVQSDRMRQLAAVVKALELKSGLKWRSTLETVTAGGVFVGFDAQTQGLVLLAKSSDSATLKRLIDTIVDAARQEAERKATADPFRAKSYRGIDAYGAGKGGFAQVGPWLVVVTKDELAKTVVDRLLDGGEPGLAANDSFRAARKAVAAGNSLWLYANVQKLKEAGIGLFQGKTPNPGVELLVGGIMEALKDAPYATARLDLDRLDRLGLTLAIPHDPGKTPPARHFFFGPNGTASAERPLQPRGSLLTLTAFRDVGAMWMAADELFSEQVAAKLAKQDSQLGVFFNGKNFGSDILGQLHPQIQLVLARQNFEDQTAPTPAIKFPAGALVVRLKEPDSIQKQLRVAFQTIVGFLNISGTQAGRPLLELKNEQRGEATIISATYLVDAKEQEKTQGKTFYNFSPSIVQKGNYFILCSTRELAIDLADQVGGDKSVGTIPANTQIRLDAQTLGEVLGQNRQTLIARNQLEKGHSKEQAATQIDALLSFLSLLQDAQLNLISRAQQLQLKLDLTLAPNQTP